MAFDTKAASLTIAVLDMIFASLTAMISVAVFATYIGTSVAELTSATLSDEDRVTTGQTLGLLIAVSVGVLAICFGKFYLGLMLWKAANCDDYRKCRLWFIASAVVFAFNLLGSLAISSPWYSIAINLGYQTLSLAIVNRFMEELKNGRKIENTITSGQVGDGAEKCMVKVKAAKGSVENV